MPRKIHRKNPAPALVPKALGPVAKKAKRPKTATPQGSPVKPPNPPTPPIATAAPDDPQLARATHDDLIARAFSFAATAEGVLVLIIAPPRSGKSDLAKKIVHARALSDIVLIHDPKIPPCYPWAETLEWPQTVDTIAAAQTSVLRFDEGVRPDDLVALGMEISREQIPTTTVIDENSYTTKGERVFDGPNLQRAYTQGSSQGHSLVVGTQIPQWCPTVQIDFSQAVVIGRQAGRTLDYLIDKLKLPEKCARAIPLLKVGEWVLVPRYEKWDETIYYSPEGD